MSPEKALGYLDESNFDITGEEPGRIQEALNLAKEALTKTMVCEPVTKKDRGDALFCSACNREVSSITAFCPHCGQRMKGQK